MKEENETAGREQDGEDDERGDVKSRTPQPADRPVRGVKHVPEPDAENIMPAEHEPGTM